jgi:hypothetical protein
MAALDDSPRPGKAPEITTDAKAWLVSLACQKAKDLGYPHELWTTRLLARHVREHAEAAGHPCMANIAQGTVCKILARNDVKPHKVRYYLERRDEAFETKMANVLCVYREVAVLRARQSGSSDVAIISYDEKPGIQAIANTAPDLPPKPGQHEGFARDHEYKRHGTLSDFAMQIVDHLLRVADRRRLVAPREQLARAFRQLLLPGADHRRMDAEL